MNKSEVQELFKETLQVNGVQAGAVMNKIFTVLADKLKAGEEVVLPCIGKLFVKERAAHQGRNPKTGEPIQIAASKKLGAKMMKDFKEALNA